MDNKQILQQLAMSLVGVPYVWGGNSPLTGLDCSGLACELLRTFGLLAKGEDWPAQGLYTRFPAKLKEPKFGALVFFGKSAAEITHVGLCLNDQMMLEAGGGGSQTKTPQDAHQQDARVRIRPITSRKDFVSFNMPPWPWKE